MTEASTRLQREASIPLGKQCAREEWEKFQSYLGADYDLLVYSRDFMNELAYRGNREGSKKVAIYHADRHYYVIRSLPKFLGYQSVCNNCMKSLRKGHVCSGSCPYCARSTPCEATSSVLCADCGLTFPSPSCFTNHLPRCSLRRRCSECGVNHSTALRHVCNRKYCTVCREMKDLEHQCFMAPKPLQALNPKQLYVFYDFESMLDADRRHVPNLCVAHAVCASCMHEPIDQQGVQCDCGRVRKVFKGEGTLDAFGTWLFSGRMSGGSVLKVIALAHNGRGYDMHFLLDFLHSRGVKPEIIRAGRKLMKIKYRSVICLDSLNFIPMALSKIPKTFALSELKKGYFPHLFNTWDRQDYVGALPRTRVL